MHEPLEDNNIIINLVKGGEGEMVLQFTHILVSRQAMCWDLKKTRGTRAKPRGLQEGQCGPVLSCGQSSPADLLSLHSSLGQSLDHMGGNEDSKGPKFCPTDILVIRWWVQPPGRR